MSSAERQRTEPSKHLCQRCRDRKARFRYRGVVRADRDHPPSLLELRRGATLCFECYRREVNRARARRLAEAAAPPRSPFARQQAAGGRVLDEQQLAHRQRMLDYLQRQPRRPLRRLSYEEHEDHNGNLAIASRGRRKLVSMTDESVSTLERHFDEMLKKGRATLAKVE